MGKFVKFGTSFWANFSLPKFVADLANLYQKFEEIFEQIWQIQLPPSVTRISDEFGKFPNFAKFLANSSKFCQTIWQIRQNFAKLFGKFVKILANAKSNDFQPVPHRVVLGTHFGTVGTRS